MSNYIKASKLTEMLAKAKAAEKVAKTKVTYAEEYTEEPTATGMGGELITYNHKQRKFIDLVASGASCVLIGAAGTGKTTGTQGGAQALIATGLARPIESDGHKHLKDGTPGIVFISYTRRAVNNIRKVQSEDLKNNCITAHKLLEYAPRYFEVFDPETGISKKTMQFVPMRNSDNLLPPTITTIIVEEASMLSTEYYNQILSALGHKVQWIFIGDLNQLPPVFGPAILGFKLLKLPVVELTEVYRQALDSPIIRLAHRIISGKPIPLKEFESWHTSNKLTIHSWKKRLSPDNAVRTLGAFFNKAYDIGAYNPETDMILLPYNKSCGTIELNKHIANHIARVANAVTYEIMAGFSKHYFSEGDYVLYDKEDAIITDIEYNSIYTGAKIQPESRFLDYWGTNQKPKDTEDSNRQKEQEQDIDELLKQIAGSEDRVTQASHKITIKLLDTLTYKTVSKAADINNLLHSNSLTVHKAQGSEWRKVFVCLHQSHAAMLTRELLYTAVTRAREELYIICEPDSLVKGIENQKIKGETLAEKAEFFKGKSY